MLVKGAWNDKYRNPFALFFGVKHDFVLIYFFHLSSYEITYVWARIIAFHFYVWLQMPLNRFACRCVNHCFSGVRCGKMFILHICDPLIDVLEKFEFSTNDMAAFFPLYIASECWNDSVCDVTMGHTLQCASKKATAIFSGYKRRKHQSAVLLGHWSGLISVPDSPTLTLQLLFLYS